MTDEKQDKGRASHAGYEPGPVPNEPTPDAPQGKDASTGEGTAAAGTPNKATEGGGKHGRPEDDQDDSHS